MFMSPYQPQGDRREEENEDGGEFDDSLYLISFSLAFFYQMKRNILT